MSMNMYNPAHFRETDIVRMQALLREHNFATLITVQEGVPVVTHLPFILNSEQGSYGTLYGHMARANWQWRDLSEEQEVLVIFQGPHAYISPSWYEEGLNVPTWNYAVVHAYGRTQLISEPEELYRILASQVQTYEAPLTPQWQMALPDEFMRKKMLGTMGLKIEITRLEGKFKLSQNRPAVDREHVVQQLQKDAGTEGVAMLMQEREQQE